MHQPGFNVNGIDARPNGKTLVIVQSATGKLFTVTTGGVTDEIELADGANAANGDGILLDGRILWVVQNQLNRVATFKLSAQFEQRPAVEAHHPPALRHPDDGCGAGQVSCSS